MKLDIDLTLGGHDLPIKFAKIDTAASADLIAAVATHKLRVIAIFFLCDDAVTVKFQSGGTTDLTGAMSFAINSGIARESRHGLFETAKGEKLNVVLGGAVGIRGGLAYVEVPA